ncbi:MULTISPECIES: 2-isopropylmalate synthase [unclassified Pseudomonas]|uniref:2-isopropylmalate synthase n=1 Tax=unclassified Pseudomonas TaxID=196821 RepID=UPI0002A253BC|nr:MULTISPECIES: 2-isopropylmalate synthase [unclassified Pseudomonas]MBB1606755.1 2-isopropylmalate synthase [Pseudomonas sp. UMC76]MBB1639768.1 2-isopropylmalate synthase [Pseudomonas sp. UME83]NTX91651.1 2-isopropylmalate synthase [Pseudomonas sp. UMA643]NTY19570.1 2-isopropylmalate synthase [Pseudomonas sp. UMC3103]NTY27585.1 2-isopropylmalate synthase [Pseudomonas sp. UMA603]
MQANPQTKYRPFPAIDLPNRRWPSQTIAQAPVWLSTDLRDGNQALFEPMNRERKLRLFAELVRLGFKEIEVGFPAASRTDFEIIRQLIDEGGIPDDVTPMVMTQLREDLIDETVRAVAGARRVIVHLYNAIAPVWRRVVFGLSVDEVEQLVVRHVQLLKEKVAAHPQTEWVLQYSPETFCMAELEVSLRMCNAAIRTWDAGPGRPIIINLPTTVEVATPNVFADQIEWMHQRLERREHVVLSVHPHNDRGTGVACAEQALLAGAQRVEGCLFGNGERSGNLDLVTLALNLYTQGIHPGLDFSDIAGVARVAEACTGLPIHPRHPYVGDLVFTAFSGSHQDAIAKGFAAQAADGFWEVPYLPIDPRDLGRTYDSIVRVNSQSGKGGIAYLLQRDHGVVMPRRMQVEFSAIVQRQADSSETELSSEALWQLFARTYLAPARPGGSLAYVGHRLFEAEGGQGIVLEVELADGRRQLQGVGNGPIDAAVAALGLPIRIDSYEERSLGGGADAQALALVEVAWPGEPGTRFGAGCHANIVSASIQAVLCAVSRFAGGRVVPGGFL